MNRVFVLVAFALTLMACGEGRVDLITSDVISDAASCYQSVEVVDDSYMVALDKTCIDLELSDFAIVSPPIEQGTLPAVRDWELLATLERDIRQQYWSHFYVQADLKAPLLQAYVAGKDFLFVIERKHEGWRQLSKIQYYFHQPEPPIGATTQHYPSEPTFFDRGPDKTIIGFPIDRTQQGFTFEFDSMVPREAGIGDAPLKEKELKLGWSTVKFGTSVKGYLVGDNNAPLIKDGYVLKIYVR